MLKLVCALVLAVAVPLAAQRSPFDGVWVADVPMPGGGEPVRFVIALAVNGDDVTGTLKIGAAEAVAIEDGRLRGEVLAFRRTLDADGTRIQFLARVLDDGLHVGFMQRSASGGSRSARVINFTAKRQELPRRR